MEPRDWYDKATVIAAIIAAICTGAAASFTGYQAWIAKDTAKRQLRAYISVPEAYVKYARNGARPDGWIAISNAGQTPAYQVQLDSETRILDYPLITSFTFLTNHHYEIGNLGPQSKLSPSQIGDEDLPADEFAELKNGQRRIFLYGTITYKDVFKKQHYTNYCLNFVMDNPVGNFCDTHNDSDEE
jgi:hypothetical protein